MNILRSGTSLLALRGALVGMGTGISVPSGPVYANTFSVDVSPASSTVGSTVIVTVTPIGGMWPANQAVTGTYSGSGGSFNAISVLADSSSSFSFTGTVSTAGSGMINATISAMTSTGGKTYTATAAATVTPPPTPTTNANRYDVAFSKSAIAPGGTVAGIVYPTNGKWNSGGNVLLTPSNGDPAITVALPMSGNSSVAFSYTAGASAQGTVRFAMSNTTGLVNAEPPTLTIFTASAGTARNISATFAPLLDLEGTQRATPSGDPAGFSLWQKGWGRGLLTITAIDGATTAIWMQPFAADPHASPGQGLGAALHAPVQVYGAVSSTGLIEVLLPAGIPWLYWKIAGDQAMTNATMIPQRARIGHVEVHLGRSILNTITTLYAYGSIPAYPYPNQNTTTIGTANAHSSGDITGIAGAAILQYDNTSTDPVGYYGSSSAAMELGRLKEQDLGVGVTIKWICENGQSTSQALDHDGNFLGTINATLSGFARTGFRELQTGWAVNGSGEWSDSAYPNTVAERVHRYAGMAQKLVLAYPSCAVIVINDGGEGYNGGDGSRRDDTFPGPARMQAAIGLQIAAINPMVVSRYNANWNANFGGHPTMGIRPQIARSMHQCYLQGENASWGGLQVPYGQRGPSLWATAQWVPGTSTLRWFGNLNGGGSLKTFLFTGTDQQNGYSQGVPTAAQLAASVGVYAGYPSYFAGGQLLETLGLTISTSNLPANADFSLDILLHVVNGQAVYAAASGGGPAPIPSDFTLQWGDYGSSCAALKAYDGPAAVITDTAHISATNGVVFGFEMNPANDAHAS